MIDNWPILYLLIGACLTAQQFMVYIADIRRESRPMPEWNPVLLTQALFWLTMLWPLVFLEVIRDAFKES